ncbi:protein translocase subunit SecD [Leptospira sp. GIMC2001]|uniref:protein translocase subunit SecD n=1 Tax=Leptospira sp. GIMC2001 TaxID=1513297 RepID=UPI00234C0297|nr:protein translocase subunit SecD [Leptospira sp. GIMC2001]WCL48390.1 protein translocase subunit SecD [Leptospira sp. GIMC2001]
MKSRQASIIPVLAVVAAILVLYPSFGERELELAVRPEFKEQTQEQQIRILSEFEDRWFKDYDPEKEWTISPKPTEYKGEEIFKVSGRFITSAKINQISQENSELIWESKNHLVPTLIENWIKSGKPLAIKFGLDLQGGMRVVLKGDFDIYVSKLRDIYSKEISDLNAKKNDLTLTEDERKEAIDKLEEIESRFELTPFRKQIELEKAKTIIDNRLTNQNLTEPQVRIQSESESVEVSLPGVTNSARILEILQSTETVEYRLEEPASSDLGSKIAAEERRLLEAGKKEETDIVKLQNIVKNRLGKDAQDRFIQSLEKKYNIPTDRYKLFTLWARGANSTSPLLPRSFIVLERSIALSGNDLTNAQPAYNPNSLAWTVSFSLTPQGADRFFELTSQNRGRNLAIVWGDKVVSNPTINDPIAGGRAEISGSFNQEEATRLSNVISEGSLPIPLSVLEMRFIGPTLGLESIKVGIKSVVIGFILVMFYMIFYYGLAGFIADVTLLVNVTILMALLSLMDFTLTLPGFAGIILTVGMAVDANVIIYERIREELDAGKHITQAVSRGFENAFWTIIDANVTTLISGILMIRLGNGPIKGFAITLCWGIITSLFTSLVVSRILMELSVNELGVSKLRLGFNLFNKKKEAN